MKNSSAELIVVIPCYNEPDVMLTINSLFACQKGNFAVEVIVVVNTYCISTPNIQDCNRLSYKRLTIFAQMHNTPCFCLTPLFIENLPGHQTGAGLPRKIGMDVAADRFCKGKIDGIIVSLDADCTVENNYLTEIYYCFKHFRLKSATIQFHHIVENLSENEALKQVMKDYERYLRYYRLALEYVGYPYAYYTIGSAFAVSAKTYLEVGGMGKQQAGEDFYFLQKVFPLGNTQFIDTTCVYPAARVSDRVPFGTGKIIKDRIAQKQPFLTFQVDAFTDLKCFFSKIDTFFHLSNKEIEYKLTALSAPLYMFLMEDNFLDKIKEINQHTANQTSFIKRFFNYFNAFKILKYLRFAHINTYSLSEIRGEYKKLMTIFYSE